MEKLIFQDENGDPAEFYVLEQTRVGGNDYLLVADAPDGDAQCLILKDTAGAQEKESLYKVVEDERELNALLTVFEQLMEDVTIDKQGE